MKISFRSIFSAALSVVGVAKAGWREECNFGGSAMFHILWEKPILSTLCPDKTGRQICTMLDLSYCLMNSNGHLVTTMNGNFDRSCKDCKLTGHNGTIFSCGCRMFGKGAPFQDTEVDLEDFVQNRNGRLCCWDSQPVVCPGFV